MALFTLPITCSCGPSSTCDSLWLKGSCSDRLSPTSLLFRLCCGCISISPSLPEQQLMILGTNLSSLSWLMSTMAFLTTSYNFSIFSLICRYITSFSSPSFIFLISSFISLIFRCLACLSASLACLFMSLSFSSLCLLSSFDLYWLLRFFSYDMILSWSELLSLSRPIRLLNLPFIYSQLFIKRPILTSSSVSLFT